MPFIQGLDFLLSGCMQGILNVRRVACKVYARNFCIYARKIEYMLGSGPIMLEIPDKCSDTDSRLSLYPIPFARLQKSTRPNFSRVLISTIRLHQKACFLKCMFGFLQCCLVLSHKGVQMHAVRQFRKVSGLCLLDLR